MNAETLAKAKEEAVEYFNKAGIVITEEEKGQIEIADFGLDDIDHVGLGILVYVNTERVCAKELVLFPQQACVEHRHPPVGDDPGKEETFRCRWGEVYLYVPGEKMDDVDSKIPQRLKGKVSVFHEITLDPGRQYTLPPNTPHWFKAGPDGAVVSEFSTRSTDYNDIFTDESVIR